MNIYEFILLIWNVCVMLIYGVDKMLAKMKKRRISESFLLTVTYLLGCYGAMFGMVLFNHKTSKMKFRTLVPLAVILWTAIFVIKKI